MIGFVKGWEPREGNLFLSISILNLLSRNLIVSACCYRLRHIVLLRLVKMCDLNKAHKAPLPMKG